MRLTERQTEIIQNAATRYFGPDVRIWLFGSRLNDKSSGGDIDLYVETAIQKPDELIEAKLKFLMQVHKALGERKIDVVIARDGFNPELPICRHARETGILLT
ncbi:MAG: nucleotidyltransferase domain-containing protein [Candidatus Methylumidiphilus sp.]